MSIAQHYHVHEGVVGRPADCCSVHTSAREAREEAAARARDARESGLKINGDRIVGYCYANGGAYIEIIPCTDPACAERVRTRRQADGTVTYYSLEEEEELVPRPMALE